VTVLVIQNDPSDPVQLVGEWLTAQGLDLDVVMACDGEAVPSVVPPNVDAVIALGGVMNANDDIAAPWLVAERALLADAVRQDVPTLGICLGGQLLAVAIGGTVVQGQQSEIGVVEVERTPAGRIDTVTAALAADTVLATHWHNDHITNLPSHATLLLTNETAPVQAFRVGASGYGLQMHPEVTAEVFATWAKAPDDAVTAQGIDVDEAVAAVARHAPQVEETWKPVIDAWAHLVRQRG
jgi:GMP synthase (glutamine-hydrolysing)